MALATNSFPVPVSPLIKTAASLPATRGTCSMARSKAGAWPTILVDEGESESRGVGLRILSLSFHWLWLSNALPRPTQVCRSNQGWLNNAAEVNEVSDANRFDSFVPG